jgi:phosphate transport system substrate-binding protein
MQSPSEGRQSGGGPRILRALALLGVVALLSLIALAACKDNNDKDKTPAAGNTPAEGQTPEPSVSGTISIEGSSTVQPYTIDLIELFKDAYPDVKVNPPSGLGSGAGITAFINKEVDIAQASRQIKDDEISQAQAAGLDPFENHILDDALAIVVHPDNPVDQLTEEQVAKIFAGEITDWSEVGGDGGAITVYTRNEESGSFAYMEEDVIQKVLGADAAYSADINKQANAPAGLTAVSNDPAGIFYAGLGNIAEVPEGSVKTVKVAADASSPYYEPSQETVKAKQYPISRGLYYYTDGDPATNPNPAVKAWIDFALSADGQAAGQELGFIPVQ